MQVDVIAMVEKTIQSIMDWQLRCDREGKLRAVYADGFDQPPERAWKDLALRIHGRKLEDNHSPLEFFLYLRDGLDNGIYDYGLLGEIIAAARSYTEGGKLYVVWDRLPEQAFVQIFSDEPNQILLAESFHALLQGGVTDVIEIPRLPRPQGARSFDEKKKLLRGYAAASEKRQQELSAVGGARGWGYVLRNEAWLLENLLKELARESARHSPAPRHVVIFDDTPNYRFGGPGALLDKFRGINPASEGIVAATPEGYSRDLSLQCGKATPPLKLVTFNGIFEVMYALLLLNRQAQGRPGKMI